jgi:hypothetical protein
MRAPSQPTAYKSIQSDTIAFHSWCRRCKSSVSRLWLSFKNWWQVLRIRLITSLTTYGDNHSQIFWPHYHYSFQLFPLTSSLLTFLPVYFSLKHTISKDPRQQRRTAGRKGKESRTMVVTSYKRRMRYDNVLKRKGLTSRRNRSETSSTTRCSRYKSSTLWF